MHVHDDKAFGGRVLSICRGDQSSKVSDLQPIWFRSLFGDPKDFFTHQLSTMPDVVKKAVADGNAHILPVVLACGLDVPTARQTLGRATWRKIHHANEHTNFMRSLVWLRFKSEANWHDIVDLKDCHLRSCRNAIDWPTARYAGNHAALGQFVQTAMMYCDVVKMGGQPDDAWSLAKLKRDYVKRKTSTSVAAANPEPWAVPFTFKSGGFKFERLNSDRDFILESNAMRHCVATYQEDARSEDVYFLRCTGLERATIRCDRAGTFEIRSFANGLVSKSCEAAAQVAVRQLFSTNTAQ